LTDCKAPFHVIEPDPDLAAAIAPRKGAFDAMIATEISQYT
jgi:hypothetical protein